MDGVGIPIIERPRPLHNHDTPNPTHHPYTLKCEEPAKVARNLTRSFFAIGHKRCNFNDRISMSEICAWELRATLLGNQPDWKPTHETTYQHTRRRCDGRRMDRRARASFATRRRAKRDRQVSRADGPSDARNNATAATTRRPQQREGRCTRYGARHPIRRGALPTDRVQRTQSQEQTRNLRDAGLAAALVGGGRAWPDNESTRRAKLAARTARGRATAHGRVKQPGPQPQLSSSSANTPRRAVAAVGYGDAGGSQAVAQLVGASAFG